MPHLRYHNIDVVKVPSTALESWRSANRAKAEQDKLMLAYSPSMSFACLTNTHFTHAMKLGGGDRTLFNDGRTVLKFSETNEWKAIRDEGILAAVYDEALWADKDALVSLMLGDNLNAAVQIGEDEVQAFGRVDVIVTELAHSQHSNPVQISIRTVYDVIEKEGFGNSIRRRLWTLSSCGSHSATKPPRFSILASSTA